MVFLWMMPTIVAALGLFVAFVMIYRKSRPPRAPKPQRPPVAIIKVVKVSPTPPPPAPAYIRRWTRTRRLHEWADLAHFEQLLKD